VNIEFGYDGKEYKCEGVPVVRTCEKGFCYELEVSLNNDTLGIIRYGKSGWKMDLVKDQKFVDAIGAEITKYFE
jgi:hypothetical protein